jgi:hypothetical protein
MVQALRGAIASDPDVCVMVVSEVLKLSDDSECRNDVFNVLREFKHEEALHAMLLLGTADAEIARKKESAGWAAAHRRLRVFLRELADHPSLQDMQNDPSLVAVLEWSSGNPGSECAARVRLLQVSPIDAPLRSRLLCDALMTTDACVPGCGPLLDQLLEPDRARLRALEQAWDGDWRTYLVQAVWPLVLIDDGPTIERLEARRDAPGITARERTGLDGLIALGQARHSPDAAPRYIRTAPLARREEVACLLEFAADSGATPEALRRAVDSCYDHAKREALALTKREKSARGMAAVSLIPVREVAVRRGILTEEDWPEVAAASKTPRMTP